MDHTPNLLLPYIMAAQAQKHVTHNEAIRALDAIVQIGVLDRDGSAPPATPAEGDRYIVGAGPTGAWSGQAGRIAAWQDGAWAFHTPREGWLAWIADENGLVVWDGTSWATVTSGGAASVNPTPLVGVNATADTTNRLSVSSPASLFNHSGAGHQQKINKASASDTASWLLQTGFSGRAEVGLTGDDNLHVKVSADGSTWKEALIIDRTTGAVAFPLTGLGTAQNLLINGDFQINQRGFAGGALATGAYGFDRWKADTGGAAISLAGLVLTLTSGALVQLIEPAAFGLSTLASTQLTVSVEGLAGGNLTVGAGSASGTITAGSGRRSVTLTTAAGDTGNLAIRLAPASSAVSFASVRVEFGAAASPWIPRPAGIERLLCQRYFAAGIGSPANFGVAWHPAYVTSVRIPFPTLMRATPTMTLTNGAAPWSYLIGSYTAADTSTATELTADGFSVLIYKASAPFTAGSAYFIAGNWKASAEL